MIEKWDKRKETWLEHADMGYWRVYTPMTTVPLDTGIIDWCQQPSS